MGLRIRVNIYGAHIRVRVEWIRVDIRNIKETKKKIKNKHKYLGSAFTATKQSSTLMLIPARALTRTFHISEDPATPPLTRLNVRSEKRYNKIKENGQYADNV